MNVESDGIFANARLTGYQDVRVSAGNSIGEANCLAHRF
jgi:hypothetical protein